MEKLVDGSVELAGPEASPEARSRPGGTRSAMRAVANTMYWRVGTRGKVQ